MISYFSCAGCYYRYIIILSRVSFVQAVLLEERWRTVRGQRACALAVRLLPPSRT